MNKKAICSAFFLALGVHAGAFSQTAPSWRSEAERPERVDAPPEVGAPDISFKVDRAALFGTPLGYAPDTEPVAPEPEIIVEQPELSSDLSSDISQDVSHDGPLDPSNDAELTASQTSVEEVDPEPIELLDTDDVDEAETEQQATDAQEERAAVQEAATVVPEQAVVSVGKPVSIAETLAPALPTQPKFKLVRSETVAPDYPKKAARLGEEGWVDLKIVVAPDGKVSEVSVVDSQPRHVFDSAARRAARKWRYEPPALAGIEQPISAKIRLNFVLD